MMSNALYDQTGRPVALGAELGRGGEGRVLDVPTHPGTVAKIYLKAPSSAQAAKFCALVATSSADLIKCAAWPTGTLHQTPGGPVIGLLMPKVVGHKEVHTLYSPAQRKHLFPDADWYFLVRTALNCAIAFDAVHRSGHVIGDVNQSNVLVRPKAATVFLIDCDSYQVSWNGRLFPCEVGVPQYTPPELQGLNFKGAARNANHDRFGLAVLIFHLLFMGRHPFVGKFLGRGEMPIEKAIKEHRFAFGRCCSSVQMNPPPKSLPLSALPPGLTALFERAFANASSLGTIRPTAAEWAHTLASFEKQLKPCRFDIGHKYSSHLPNCPWCELMKSGAPNFFISVAIHKGVTRSAFVLGVCWSQIESVAPPRKHYQRPVLSSQFRLLPKPLPIGVPRIVPPRIPVKRDFTQNIVGCVAVVTAAIFSFILFGMLSKVFLWIGLFGMVSCVIFSTWWYVLES